MGGPTGRLKECRIRRGYGKKLRRAVRWREGNKATADWLAEQALDDPEAEAEAERLAEDAVELTEAEEPFYRAWDILRHDRQFGAFGGLSPIPFGAFDRFADRYGIEGDDFELYRLLIAVIDDEFRALVAEKLKSET